MMPSPLTHPTGRKRTLGLLAGLCLAGIGARAQEEAGIYEAKLDASPRAAERVSSPAMWSVSEKWFRKMQSEYRAESFDVWLEKLKRVHPGMTVSEIEDVLEPKMRNGVLISSGSGIRSIFFLDDAYFIRARFFSDGKLMEIDPHPTAVTYRVGDPEDCD